MLRNCCFAWAFPPPVHSCRHYTGLVPTCVFTECSAGSFFVGMSPEAQIALGTAALLLCGNPAWAAAAARDPASVAQGDSARVKFCATHRGAGDGAVRRVWYNLMFCSIGGHIGSVFPAHSKAPPMLAADLSPLQPPQQRQSGKHQNRRKKHKKPNEEPFSREAVGQAISAACVKVGPAERFFAGASGKAARKAATQRLAQALFDEIAAAGELAARSVFEAEPLNSNAARSQVFRAVRRQAGTMWHTWNKQRRAIERKSSEI